MPRKPLRTFAIYLLVIAVITSTILINDPSTSAASDGSPDLVLAAFPHDTSSYLHVTAAVRFSDTWGDSRSNGRRRHKGTDIRSPQGTIIVAVADGVITKMAKGRLAGFYIRIDHRDGWATAYMHLSNDTHGTNNNRGGEWTAFHPLLVEGDIVRAGQVIGYVGNSGNAESMHTHFEITHEGVHLNPYPFLLDVLEREKRLPSGQGVY